MHRCNWTISKGGGGFRAVMYPEKSFFSRGALGGQSPLMNIQGKRPHCVGGGGQGAKTPEADFF